MFGRHELTKVEDFFRL